MKVAVLGPNGLLGSHLINNYSTIPLVCDVTSTIGLVKCLGDVLPDVVINCAGVVPKAEKTDHEMFGVNSYGPKILRNVCDLIDIRLVHISTDCVFSGKHGEYTEQQSPDPNTLYGMSKHLGEITDAPHLTIRTSFVGLPDPKERGLLAWAAQQDSIIGFDHHLWNGLTTTELAARVFELIHVGAHGLIHLCGETLSKYDLLCQAKEHYSWKMPILKQSDMEETIPVNRTLSSVRKYKFKEKSFEQMLRESNI